MKDFIESLGKYIEETAETVTSKAGDAIEIQKLKSQFRRLERENEIDFIKLGQVIYGQYKEGGLVSEEESFLCECIAGREDKIVNLMKRVSILTGTMGCANCGKTVEKDMSFCPYCGTKIEKETVEEECCCTEEMEEECCCTEEMEEECCCTEEVEEEVELAEETAQAEEPEGETEETIQSEGTESASEPAAEESGVDEPAAE